MSTAKTLSNRWPLSARPGDARTRHNIMGPQGAGQPSSAARNGQPRLLGGGATLLGSAERGRHGDADQREPDQGGEPRATLVTRSIIMIAASTARYRSMAGIGACLAAALD